MKKRSKAVFAIFCVILVFYMPVYLNASNVHEQDGYIFIEDVISQYPYLDLSALEELIGREITSGLFPFREGRYAVYVPSEFTYINGERGMYIVFAEFGENGVEITQKYSVLSLVRCDDTRVTFNEEVPYEWEDVARRNFVPQRNRIYIVTIDDMRYGFAITTGAIETTDALYTHAATPSIDPRDVVFGVTARQGAVIGVGVLLASGLVIVFLYFLDS